MKLAPCITRLRAGKFAPFAIFCLFVFSNLSGALSSPVFAPSAKIIDPVLAIPADIPSSGDSEIDRVIFEASERSALDPRFVHAVIWQESKYDTKAKSQAGAQGLMQLMPATAKRFGCTDVDDPTENVEAGTKYLAWLLKRFSGNVELALAGYNAGEGSVDKYHGIPPFTETQNYVHIITGRYGKTFHPLLSSDEAKVAFNLIGQPATTAVNLVQ
jgi:soluble lytic murein transglycosylase-like protein